MTMQPQSMGPPQQPPKSALPAVLIVVIVIFGAVCVLGVLAAIAIPAQIRYLRRAKSSEAVDKLSYLYRSSATYASMERPGAVGATRQVPMSAPMTPSVVPMGARAMTPSSAWAHPTWTALDFAIADPHYYAYTYESSGQMFTARANGDLDGDGRQSTFERAGQVNALGEVSGALGIFMNHEIE